jgi:hypothetical protein
MLSTYSLSGSLVYENPQCRQVGYRVTRNDVLLKESGHQDFRLMPAAPLVRDIDRAVIGLATERVRALSLIQQQARRLGSFSRIRLANPAIWYTVNAVLSTKGT